MLKQLNIQNLAIAKNVTVQFQNGFNVITGETGAGKSLLVEAMSLLRGCRVELSLIRSGHDSAQVTGIFIPNKNDSIVFSMLENLGIPRFEDDPNAIIIKRYIQRNGKHKATVNENLVSSKILQTIASELIDISSQFENQKLLDSETHTSFLDEIAGNSLLYKEYLSHYNQAQERLKKIAQIIKEQNLIYREKKLYEFELSQIIEANISEIEFKNLEETISIGNKNNISKNICSEINLNLCNNDINCIDILKYTKKNIEKLFKNSPQNEVLIYIEKIDEIITLVEDLVNNIELTSNKFEINESVFMQANQRIETYNKMLSRFGPNFDDIIQYKKKCEEYLIKSENINDELNIIIKNCEIDMKNAIEYSKKISINRNNKLTYISNSVQKELSALGMQNTKFVCDLKNITNIDENKYSELKNVSICQNTLKIFNSLSKTGAEKAQFLLSTNLGIDIQPIEKIASGGELSRIMLAIKNILFGEDTMSVFVFDEIDSGISGNIATKVGRKLSEFCKNSDGLISRQALCITHLAQVACFAQNHFIASKEFVENKTLTKITQANNEEKLNEIAILLSGEEISQESLAQAKVLISEAKKEPYSVLS